MFTLIKSEIIYLKILAVVMFAVIPLVAFLQTALEDVGNFALLAVLFLLLQNWNTFRNKEKREYKNILLPISARKIAISRLAIVIIFCLAAVFFYRLIQLFFPAELFTYSIAAPVITGIILLGFSIYFILRDLLLVFFRRIGLTAPRMLMLIAFTGIALNILGVAVLIQTKSSGRPPAFLPAIIEGFKTYNPYNGASGPYLFLLTSVIAGLVSIISYSKRKAYLE